MCFVKDANENCDLVFELLNKNGKYYIYAYNNYSSFLTLKANFMTIEVTYNDGTSETIDGKLNKSFDANSELAIPINDEALSDVKDISIIFDRSILRSRSHLNFLKKSLDDFNGQLVAMKLSGEKSHIFTLRKLVYLQILN